MSTDVYIDYGKTANIDNLWYKTWKNTGQDLGETERIGHLALMGCDGFDLIESIRKTIKRYPIFNSMAAAELCGIVLAAERRGRDHSIIFDSDDLDYLTIDLMKILEPKMLGHYWYLRVD